MKFVAPLLLLGATLLSAGAAHADDATRACVASYEEGQVLRKDGKLTGASQRFLVCAQANCSPVLRKQCTEWLAELEQQTPSIVIAARGKQGEDLVDVRVTLDGNELTRRLDGKAVSLDPGPHVFRFEIDDAAPIDERVVVSQGERSRRVVADFRPASTSSPAEPVKMRPAPIPLAVPILGGVSVAGFGFFTAFGLLGLQVKNDLDSQQCKPTCSQSQVDLARRRFLIADVGLGVGVSSFVIAGLLLLTKGEVREASPAPQVGFSPAPGGATVSLSATF